MGRWYAVLLITAAALTAIKVAHDRGHAALLHICIYRISSRFDCMAVFAVLIDLI